MLTTREVQCGLARLGIDPLGPDDPVPMGVAEQPHDPTGCFFCSRNLPCRKITAQMQQLRIKGVEVVCGSLLAIRADDEIAA